MSWSPDVHIEGVRPPDDEWKKKAAAWRACEEAGCGIPRDLYDFFGDDPPTEGGAIVSVTAALESVDAPYGMDVGRGADSWGSYYIVHLDRLPANVKQLRVYMR